MHEEVKSEVFFLILINFLDVCPRGVRNKLSGSPSGVGNVLIMHSVWTCFLRVI